MAIDVSSLRVGNGYLFDPTKGIYYQGASPGSPMAPTGDSAFDWRTQDPNYGSQLWGASPGSFGNYGVGSTQWNFAQSGQGSPVNLGDFTNIPSNLQGWFAPGTNIQSYTKAPQAVQVTQAPDEGFMGSFKYVAPFIGGGLLGYLGGLGSLGSASGALAPGESAVAGSGVWSGGNPIGGGGMWDWLDSIMNNGNTIPSTEWPTNTPWSGGPGTGTGDIVWDGGLGSDTMIPGTSYPAQNFWNTGSMNVPGQGMVSIDGGLPESMANFYGNSFGLSPSQIDLLKNGGQAAKSLWQTLGGGGGLGGGNGGGILGQIMNDPLGSAFNATPFLLALAQANKQAGDLNGVLSKINGEGYTNAVLHPYDLATGQGRTALEQSLSDRGVAGSSFGYNDLNNYDYMRNLGRGDLANKAQMTSAGLEGSLINQRNTNTNLLLGAGLNASGQLFSPKKDPFGLGNLGLASLLG